MKKYCISIIVCLFTFLSFGQKNNLSQQQALNTLKEVIEMDEGTFPRDMGNGQSWDKNAIEGNDYVFYYTIDNPRAVSSGMKMDNETAKKIFIATMVSSDQETREYFLSVVAQAGLNLVYAYRFSSSVNYTVARMTNMELKDFLEGKLSVTPLEVIESIAEQYKLSTPCQVEPGIILTKVEIKDDKYVMYLAVDNANILNNIQANKDAIKTNLKAALRSPSMSSMCGMVASANMYLVYYYYCEGVSGSCVFAFSPEELMNKSSN